VSLDLWQRASSWARSAAVGGRGQVCFCSKPMELDVPARQGTHLPQDSSRQNPLKNGGEGHHGLVLCPSPPMPPEPK